MKALNEIKEIVKAIEQFEDNPAMYEVIKSCLQSIIDKCYDIEIKLDRREK